MKKLLVVLLIAVLVSGFAFADAAISGGQVITTAHFDWTNHDNIDYGIHTMAYVNGALKFNLFDFGKGNSLATNNATYPYADVEVALTLKANKGISDLFDDSDKNHPGLEIIYDPENGYAIGGETGFDGIGFKYAISLEKAEIVGENWVLDLIHGPVMADYAASPEYTEHIAGVTGYDKKTHKSYCYDSLRDFMADEGISFSLTDRFNLGLILKNDNDHADGEVEQHAVIAIETAEAAGQITDKISVQGAVAYEYQNGEGLRDTVYTSVQLSAEDAAEFHVAADLAFGNFDEKHKVHYDVAADFHYDALTADFYWSNDTNLILMPIKATGKPVIEDADPRYVEIARATLDFSEKLPEFAPKFQVFVADDPDGHLGNWHIDATVAGAFNPFIIAWSVKGENLNVAEERSIAVSATANLLAIAPDFPATAFTFTASSKDVLNFYSDEASNALSVRFDAADLFVAGLNNYLVAKQIGKWNDTSLTYGYSYIADKFALVGDVGSLVKDWNGFVDFGAQYEPIDGLTIAAYATYQTVQVESERYYTIDAIGAIEYTGKFDVTVAGGVKYDGVEGTTTPYAYANASSKNIITGAELAIEYGAVNPKAPTKDLKAFTVPNVVPELAKCVTATCTINF